MENIPHVLWPCVCKGAEGFRRGSEPKALTRGHTSKIGNISVLTAQSTAQTAALTTTLRQNGTWKPATK